jgi:hypothetical protein
MSRSRTNLRGFVKNVKVSISLLLQTFEQVEGFFRSVSSRNLKHQQFGCKIFFVVKRFSRRIFGFQKKTERERGRENISVQYVYERERLSKTEK